MARKFKKSTKILFFLAISGHSSASKRLFWKFRISFDSQKSQLFSDIFIISGQFFITKLWALKPIRDGVAVDGVERT
jgi:hypothetical protein